MKIRKALETTIKRIKTEKAGEWIWKDGGGGIKGTREWRLGEGRKQDLSWNLDLLQVSLKAICKTQIWI